MTIVMIRVVKLDLGLLNCCGRMAVLPFGTPFVSGAPLRRPFVSTAITVIASERPQLSTSPAST